MIRDGDMTPAAAAGLLDALTTIVSRAAAAILAARAGALGTRTKADLSPVTAADEASEAVILAGVSQLMPGIPIVSEEAASRAPPAALSGPFVLVDPVDGTRELVAGRDEFCVNLALIRAGRPVLGIVAAPALGLLWRAVEGFGAGRLQLDPGAPVGAARGQTPIQTRPMPERGLIAAISRSHFDADSRAFLARLPQATLIASGSAIKFCRLAEGAVDIYPRLAPTMEWDVAAGHAVLAAAGGLVTAPDGGPLAYGREDFRIPGFIAWGDRLAAKAGLERHHGPRVS